jgi:hypothetical protein
LLGKFDMTTTEANVESLTTKFKQIGIDQKKAQEAAGNKKLAPVLSTVIDQVRLFRYCYSG